MEFNHGRDLSNVALVVSEERIHSHEDVSRWFAKSVLTDLAPWACVSLGFGKTLAGAQCFPITWFQENGSVIHSTLLFPTVPDAETEEDPRTGQHWKVVVLN